ncbi:MAG TPA: NfeD family protein [Burkholderiaceae bacterium]|nr:NfeD family protein [Burkholderiaceae bacterium]
MTGLLAQQLSSPWLWLILGAVLAALEIVAPGVYLLWIGLGAIIVGLSLAVAPELPLSWQALIFAVAMLGSLSLGFWLQRRSRPPAQHDLLNKETQQLVGRRFRAITDFELGRGRIEVGDTSYAAVSVEPIRAGETVEVIAIEDDRPRVVRAGAAPDR